MKIMVMFVIAVLRQNLMSSFAGIVKNCLIEEKRKKIMNQTNDLIIRLMNNGGPMKYQVLTNEAAEEINRLLAIIKQQEIELEKYKAEFQIFKHIKD